MGAAAFAVPSAASAQYVLSRSNITYTPLSNPTIITTDVDDGATNLTGLPWPIEWYGQQFDSISVGHNGALLFPSGQFVSLGNVAPGGTGTPNNFIAPFWDDLRLYSQNNGYIGFQLSGTAPNRVLELEFNNISRFGSTGVTFSFIVRARENGSSIVEIDYGPMNNSASFSATMGMEGNNGQGAILFAPSACTTSCGTTDYNAVANTRITITPPPEPQLFGAFDPAFPGGLLPGTSATMAPITLSNGGTNTATAVVTNLFLSTDNMLDATDVQIGTTTNDVVFGDTAVTASVTVPANQPPGQYFVIMDIDATDRWPETDENDNVVVSDTPFNSANELAATSINVLNMGGVNAGDTLSLEVTISNAEPRYSGPLELGFFASDNQTIDMMDPSVGPATVMLTGAATETFMVDLTMPVLNPGTYYPFVRVDPNGVITEANELNNEFLGTATVDTGPDFAAASVDIPAFVVPNTAANITTVIDSVAVPFTGNVPYRLYASEDDTLDTMNDIDLGLFNAAMAGEASLMDTESVTINLPPGRYFIIASIDPMNTITEVSMANNVVASAITLANGPDFTVTAADSSPNALLVNEMLTVDVTAENTGLPYIGNVPITIYLSLDDTYDPGDQPVYQGNIFFPGNTTGTFSQTFRLAALPGDPQITPGSYRVIARVDYAPNPMRTPPEYAEVDIDNNAGNANRITIQGSDLVPLRIEAPSIAFIGRPLPVTIEIANEGVADARGFTYSLFLSDNDIIRVNDTRIYTSQSSTITSGGTQVFEEMITLPTLTSTQCLFLGVIVNDNGRVAETNIGNNTRRIFTCIEIVFPIPDLVGQIIDTPTVAAAGEEFAVTRLINNIGVADAPSFEYTYYLSSNPTIAPTDIAIGTFSGSIPFGSDDYGIDILQVPSTVANGNYFLGMIIDPEDALDEVDETNNVVVGPSIPVFGASIVFTTNTLPNATVGVDYNVGVYASGGPLPITWSVSNGALPDGLSIDPNSGILSGTPTQEGLFEFVLRASSGTAFADKPFAIRVTVPSVELRVASPSLPTAITGREYSAQLVAVGGQPPYDWAAVSELPVGLELSEEGLLSGTPQTPGGLPITVRVRDALENAASRELVLNVIAANQTIQIVQIPLPEAVLNVEYCSPESISFEVANGTPPYSWSLVGDAPPGMSLNVDGELCGTPTQAGTFPLTVRVQDVTGLFDTSLFIFSVDDGNDLAITSFSLPGGMINQPYEAQTLTAIRGEEPYQWSVVDGTGAVPPGMTLSSEGVLSGTPSEAGTFSFVVQVVDGQLSSDVQPLSITIEPEPEPDPIEDGGCVCVSDDSEDESWASTLALLGLGGIFMLRRRRGRRGLASLLALGAVLGFGSVAEAQLMPVAGTPYQMGSEAITYAPLVNPTILTTDVDDGQAAVNLPFPFHFYDYQVTSVSLGYNGALIFPSGQFVSLGNTTPGSTGTPNDFIAPYWDDLRLYAANNGHVATQVAGTAPNRTFTIEWHNISRFGSTGVTFSMRVILYEGPAARFDLEYSPMVGSASFSSTSAMEDQNGGRPILFIPGGCTTTCNQTDYNNSLANRRITVIQDPGVELAAVGVTAPEFAFLGAETPVRAAVQNLHGNPIGPHTVEIRAADNEQMMNSVAIGSTVITSQPFSTTDIVVPCVFPASFGQTRVWLEVVVDANNDAAEVNENNNREVSVSSTRLLQGAPDVAVERVAIDVTQVDAGSDVTVFSRLRNVGGEPANNVEVAVMLSTNPVISRQDAQLGTFTVSLAAGETVNATTSVTIPTGTNSGTYYLGTIADPQNTVMELNESNNARASLDTLSIAGGALAVATSALPTGYIFEPYVALLTANGAVPPYTWEVTQGTLPTGLGLVPGTGELFGRPAMAETQTFTVQATSSDGQMATRELSITVSDPQAPLTIVTRAVPAAVIGQEYSFPIVVTGGSSTASVSWSADGLPPGFMMTSDGILAGTPQESGSFMITLRAMADGETATREVTLDIRENATLLIVPKVLSTAFYEEPYSEQLESTGGIEPIVWLVQLGELPDGLSLSSMGEISGTPTEVGRFRVVIEARDSGMNGAAMDVNTFEIVVEDTAGFDIVTDSLPTGYVNEAFEQNIAAAGGLPPYDFTILEGRLPTGLQARIDQNSNEFQIFGAPEAEGTANLLIEAVDRNGRRAQKAFVVSIINRPAVVDPIPTEDGGCVCVDDANDGVPAGLALLGLFGLVFVRRRR